MTGVNISKFQIPSSTTGYRIILLPCPKTELEDGASDIVHSEVRAHINSLVSAVAPSRAVECRMCLPFRSLPRLLP